MLLNNTEEGAELLLMDIAASSMRSGAEEQYDTKPPRPNDNEESPHCEP
jgi:hypothetical protein